MSLIKKSDVKNHLSARHQNHIHIAPASQPDATGFSGTNQASVEADRAGFAQDFTGDHTTPATVVKPSGASIGSPELHAPAEAETAKV